MPTASTWLRGLHGTQQALTRPCEDRASPHALPLHALLLPAGLGSIALVLQTLFPDGGNWWYAMTLLSPGAYTYYMSRGTRPEQVSTPCQLPSTTLARAPSRPVGHAAPRKQEHEVASGIA